MTISPGNKLGQISHLQSVIFLNNSLEILGYWKLVPGPVSNLK